MKRIFSILAAAMMAAGVMAQGEMIKIYVPEEFNIKDNVVVVNKSMCTIQQAVVAQIDGENVTPIGSCMNVASGKDATVAEFSRNGLRRLRGKYIGVKATGTSTPGEDADESAAETVTDFTITVGEKNHDLYIYLYDKLPAATTPAAPAAPAVKPTEVLVEVAEQTAEGIRVKITNNATQTIHRVKLRIGYMMDGFAKRIQLTDKEIEVSPNGETTVNIPKEKTEQPDNTDINVEVVTVE